ncbi:MAG: O-antigen ligase family protein [Phycisphaerae bacterium]
MRFLLYVSILVAIIPFVFLRPFFGLCVYYVVSLLQPKLLCWRGDFQDALLVGVPLVIGAIAIGVKREHLVPRRKGADGRIVNVDRRVERSPLFEPSWPILTAGLLVVYVAFTRLIAPFPLEHTSDQFRGLCKILLVVTLMTGLVSDSRRFRILFLVVALATEFWAIKGGLKVMLLGPHQVYGRTYDNNLFALMSVMALPMVFYFALTVRRVLWRTLLLIFAALICLGIIGSQSRAGFVAFGVVLLCMAWSSRYRLRAVLALVLIAGTALALSGAEVSKRIDSILAYRQDPSAQSRFRTWEVAEALFRESPVVGIGFNNFEIAKDRYVGGKKAAHNIFLQNLAELGFLGHPLWLAIVLGTLISLFRFMRRCRRLPPDLRWTYHCSRGLLLGMLAFCVHGFFHNEEYLELMFAIVGLAVSLQAVTRRELFNRKLLAVAEDDDAIASHRPKHLPRKRGAPDRGHPGRHLGRPWNIGALVRAGRLARAR